MNRLKKIAKWLLGGLAVLTIGLLIAGLVLNEEKPEGKTGSAADALAKRVYASVNADKFKDAKVVAFEFAGRNKHVWDRKRGLAQVQWGTSNVMFSTGDKRGRAFVDGKEVNKRSERKALIEKAYGFWINDTFWLNPVVKLFDPGVTRSIVNEDGKEHLMMQFSSGGITPGDAYLWELGKDARPIAWKMWVNIIPVGGIHSTWEDYETLSGGALVATKHSAGPLSVMITNLKSADDIRGIMDSDPFAPLNP